MKKFRQSHLLGGWWGNILLTSQHSSTFIQGFILLFSGTAAYGVISTQMHEWGYQFPFWQFISGVAIILLVLLSFVWVLGMPSVFISWNRQWWNHKNPFRKDYEEFKKQVLKDLEAIKEKVDEKQRPD